MITAAGSNPAGMFLIDAVIDGNLNESEAIEVISALPLFVKSPTAALLAQSFVIYSINNAVDGGELIVVAVCRGC